MANKEDEKKSKGDPSKKLKPCPKCKRMTNMMICTCGEILFKKK
jgi:hypothetical protein